MIIFKCYFKRFPEMVVVQSVEGRFTPGVHRVLKDVDCKLIRVLSLTGLGGYLCKLQWESM